MSHAHSVFELAEGLNVLCGPNNCGKSAVVAALRLVCYNEASTHVVRHGAREAVVEIVTGDGHTVRWSRKRNGSPRYEIDGQVFDRLGKGGVPERVHQVLKLPLVTANSEDQEFDVHFGQQQTPIFLLNAPARASAFFFASSSDAVRLVEMQNAHRQNVLDRTRDRKRLGDEERERSDLVDRLTPLNLVLDQLGNVEGDFARLCDESSSITRFAEHIAGRESLENEIDSRKRRLELLADIPEVPAAAETVALETLIAALDAQAEAIFKSTSIADAAGMLMEPPAMHLTEPIHLVISGLENADQAARATSGCADILRAVNSPPVEIETAELEMSIRSITDCERAVKDELKAVQSAGTELDDVVNAIREWISANPHCPTCGARMNELELAGIAKHFHD